MILKGTQEKRFVQGCVLICAIIVAMVVVSAVAGCGFPHPYKAETRAGWSPLGGIYFSDTKDNKATVVLKRDPVTKEWTEFNVELDNRAATANESMIPLAENYNAQLKTQTEMLALWTRMFERMFSLSIDKDGLKAGTVSVGTMNPTPGGP